MEVGFIDDNNIVICGRGGNFIGNWLVRSILVEEGLNGS